MSAGQSSLPIGVFDSGVGGLTVLKELTYRLPHESFVYLGDTARVPYGNRSPETIVRYALECAAFLAQQQIKLLVVACNTVSAFALPDLEKLLGIPVIGVIRPGAEKAALTSSSGHIAVAGTAATIGSGAYQRELLARLPAATITAFACPLFVPLVEEHFLHHPATELIVAEYLKVLEGKSVDTLLLGCTHYPFLAPFIQKKLGNKVALIDSASACAEKVAQLLEEKNLMNAFFPSSCVYYVSDDPAKFSKLAEQLFRVPIPTVHHPILNIQQQLAF